jgi:hypothetical protein
MSTTETSITGSNSILPSVADSVSDPAVITKKKTLLRKKRTLPPAVVDPNGLPKITRGLKKKIDLALINIDGIFRHIRNVQDNCLLLGKRLIERGQIELGRQLIANGFEHDVSKFYGVEWENMAPGVSNSQEEGSKLKLKMAIQHHRMINRHHVEAWPGGIKCMPDVYLAEFVSDIKSRSEEFGTSLRDWIDEVATKKWGFTKSDDVYRKIMDFAGLVCEKPFGGV